MVIYGQLRFNMYVCQDPMVCNASHSSKLDIGIYNKHPYCLPMGPWLPPICIPLSRLYAQKATSDIKFKDCTASSPYSLLFSCHSIFNYSELIYFLFEGILHEWLAPYPESGLAAYTTADRSINATIFSIRRSCIRV